MSDRLLRLALLAYPRAARARDGDVLFELSRELVADGAPVVRECAGLVRGGVAARVRLAAGEIADAPWREALSRLVLPLAAAMLALMAVGASRGGVAMGWTWTLALVGAGCALAGAAWGRRDAALVGALVAGASLALDATRDLAGAGSRWVADAGVASVNPLAMWICAGALLLLAAAATPAARGDGIRRAAWGAAPACALVVVARLEPAWAEATVVQGALALVGAVLVVGLVRLRRDPAGALAATLVALAAAPPAVWLLAARAPASLEGGGALAAYALLAAIALTAAGAVARTAASRRGDTDLS